jgi:hypothetical protein
MMFGNRRHFRELLSRSERLQPYGCPPHKLVTDDPPARSVVEVIGCSAEPRLADRLGA